MRNRCESPLRSARQTWIFGAQNVRFEPFMSFANWDFCASLVSYLCKFR